MISFADVVKAIKPNYSYHPVSFSVNFNGYRHNLKSSHEENQDVGLVLALRNTTG